MKKVILCADDYGQDWAVSQAIIELFGKQRLSATSCLVTSSYWDEHAHWLKPFVKHVDIGLHFNLTEGVPLSSALRQSHGFLPIYQLLPRAIVRKIDKKGVMAELHAQLNAFEAAMGCLPAHIDGHQHVHIFPVIQDALLEVYEQRLRATGCYIRSVDPSCHAPAWLKKVVLAYAGGLHFKRRLQALQVPHNQIFSGIYPFARAAHYGQYFQQFLAEINQGVGDGLILCHPGDSLKMTGKKDAMQSVRAAEYAWLMSDAFWPTCQNAAIGIGRFRES